ncbi:MAG TPA: phosphatase PAP2 family protein [Opitutaceae bacterium]
MDSPDSRQPPASWLRQAGQRLRYRCFTKMFGTLIAMSAFFITYFHLLNNPRIKVTTVPTIFIDQWVVFMPWAVILYVSLWIYVLLVPAMLLDTRVMRSYLWACVALSVVGFGIFLLWPTAVPRSSIAWSKHASIFYLKTVDASGNAFPSLHVAFAVFTAIWLSRMLRTMGAGGIARSLNWLWCLGIIYSTMAIRQHVALDAISGAVLGGVAARIHLSILASIRPPIAFP